MTTQSLKERAENYAASCQGQTPAANEFDYMAGALEERILIIEQAAEWLNKNMPDTAYLGLDTLNSFDKAQFINRFKQAMKNE